jgi:hypothetical protein
MKPLDHWLPPSDAGAPLACLATTFSIDTDFFEGECLPRFLGVVGRSGSDAAADAARAFDISRRLAEASVVVVADRNCSPGPRNMRWDLLPATVNGGLFQVRSAVLVWQRALRVIVGSTDLTIAGHSEQMQTTIAFDITNTREMPDAFCDDLANEWRSVVNGLCVGDPRTPGPKQRAVSILDLVHERMLAVKAPSKRQDVRIALAPARTFLNPLEKRADVWKGAQPTSVTAMSSSWDADNRMQGVLALADQLAKRVATNNVRSTTLVVDGGTSRYLRRAYIDDVAITIHDLNKRDNRRLHGNAVCYEGRDSVAVMIGSSTMTATGLGLTSPSNRTMNVWLCCDADGTAARRLKSLVPVGEPTGEAVATEPRHADDELHREPAPAGVLDATLIIDGAPRLRLTVDADRLPKSWNVRMGGSVICDQEVDVSADVVEIPLQSTDMPSSIEIHWAGDRGDVSTCWPVNVLVPTTLPLPLALSPRVLLNVLTSIRPSLVALEHEARREGEGKSDQKADAQHHQVRELSIALWGVERRLRSPASNMNALWWRLTGPFGVVPLAEALVGEVRSGRLSPDVGRFMIAELAQCLRRPDWPVVAATVPSDQVQQALTQVTDMLRELATHLAPESDDALSGYVDEALQHMVIS